MVIVKNGEFSAVGESVDYSVGMFDAVSGGVDRIAADFDVGV